MPRKRKDDHVVMRNGQPFCESCGQSYVINLPAPVNVLVGAMNGFIKTHRNCEKTWEEPTVNLSLPVADRVLWWLENGERGVSSKTMFAKLVQLQGQRVRRSIRQLPEKDWCHPRDPSDFRRCHLLLESIPELRDCLDEMREVSPVWNALVDQWEPLTAMLKEQLETGKANGMYEFMKKLGC